MFRSASPARRHRLLGEPVRDAAIGPAVRGTAHLQLRRRGRGDRRVPLRSSGGRRGRAVLHRVEAGPDDLAAELDAVDSQDFPFGSTSIFAQRCVFARPPATASRYARRPRGRRTAGRLSLFRGLPRRQPDPPRAPPASGSAAGHAARLPAGGRTPATLLYALGLLLPPRRRPCGAVGERLVPDWLSAPWLRKNGVVPRPPRQSCGPRFLSEQLWNSIRETSLPARCATRTEIRWRSASRAACRF